LAIRDDIGPQELRPRARQESDGRVAARLIAIANALEGIDQFLEQLKNPAPRSSDGSGIAGPANRRRRGARRK
jgi:hypothetical protein